MTEFDPSFHPHRRFNPLTKEYILVSPHRTKRPWLGQVEPPQATNLLQYDETCYLCPGNSRMSEQKNPHYDQTYAFENDFAAILPGPAPGAPAPFHPMLAVEPVHGTCDVLVFHPHHDLSVARLELTDIEKIIKEWIRIYVTRGTEPGIKYVQIFENKGLMMGCSNPHPHGQVWSLSAVPSIPAKELRSLKEYALTSNSAGNDSAQPCLLCEYCHAELNVVGGSRVVMSNQHWVALVPWWATWPFEVLLLPYRRHVAAINELDPEERWAFAEALSSITRRYDNLFCCSFPYSMGIHQRPVIASNLGGHQDEDGGNDYAHLHLHFEPPLLRGALIKKFLVGYERMAEGQRDLTPEQAAARLRACSDIHYLDLTKTCPGRASTIPDFGCIAENLLPT